MEGGGSIPNRFGLLLAILSLLVPFGNAVASVDAQGSTVELRDITVTPERYRMTVALLLTGPVDQLVVEPLGSDGVEIRMRSLKATDRALRSALPKPGLSSVSAHIERGDVLVCRVRFDNAVGEVAVLRRTDDLVVVGATIAGPRVSGPSLERIVIDPGHGGRDPGAIGLGGVEEKQIALEISRLLERELERRMPRARIVLTRRGDTEVSLDERADIANRERADIFVSIHCNATEERSSSVSGFECWTFRPAARLDTLEHGPGGRVVTRRTRPESTGPTSPAAKLLAESVRLKMARSTPMSDRGVRGAAFWVLARTRMPALLIECGYLTNEKDLQILNSPSGQKTIASAIADGLVEYARRRESIR